MGEDIQPPGDKPEKPKLGLRGVARRSLALIGIVGAAGAANYIAKGSDHSSRPARDPVPIETIYSSDSIPKPHFTYDTVDGRTQQLLTETGANKINNMYENTVWVLPPGTELQYTLDPEDIDLPSSAESQVRRFSVPEGYYPVLIRPRRLGLQGKEQYLNVSKIPDGASEAEGRAVELGDNLFIKQTTAEGSAELFTIDGQPPGPAEGGVDSRGNPTAPHAASSETAVVLILNQKQLDALKQKLKMRPEMAPPPAG